MQINGTGNGHNSSMHQITQCIHDETAPRRKSGDMSTSHDGGKQTPAKTNRQPEEPFSPVVWLKDALSTGRKFLRRVWGEKTGTEEPHTEQPTAIPDSYPIGYEAMVPVPARQQSAENNPYFAAIKDTGKEKQSIWEKVRVKFHSIAGQLMGRFSNRNSLQTKQEKSKDDLRKHSTYRQDDVEIDCILTDDSYLMDSYDRKGEYSKLSVKK